MFLNRLKELPHPIADFIRLAGAVGDEMGFDVYVVGGFVRDLFLGVDNFDLDLVIEGDGIAFAAECSRRLKSRLITHRRFGTASILGAGGFKVDVATARKETYDKPAALPTVSFGVIRDDLYRRDFTFNAMAIGINKRLFGSVVDYYGGQKDLEKGIVRALHSLSFIDDPTRILRAVRFEQRFGFAIEKNTLIWIKDALKLDMLHQVQKHRLRDELILIFKERSPLKALKRLYGLAGFSYISRGLSFRKDWQALFGETDKTIRWFDATFNHKRRLEPYTMYMSLFFYSLALRDLRRVMAEFAFHKGESSRIISLKERFKKIETALCGRSVKPSTVYRYLEPLSYEVILMIMVLSKKPVVRKRCEDFLSFYNGSRLHIKGEDLASIGIKPGPRYKRILQKLLYAKIDGKLKTKDEELKAAEKLE